LSLLILLLRLLLFSLLLSTLLSWNIIEQLLHRASEVHNCLKIGEWEASSWISFIVEGCIEFKYGCEDEIKDDVECWSWC
jgi:hypothetical protein